MRQERLIDAGGARLWTEGFGRQDRPCLLLSMAAYWQGIAWPVEFCNRLALGGYFVVRYDHRDTGRSTVFDYEQSPYSLVDMADDALGILDAWGIEQAHLLGGSMGGMIVQEFALRHASRVLSITSMMSTPLSRSYAAGTSGAELPGPDATAWKAFESVPGPGKLPTRDEYVDGWTAFSRGVAGSISPFNVERAQELHGESYDRASEIGAVWNHLLATRATPDRLDRLSSVDVPALVLHGRDDHVIPVSHGRATAEAIPNARLLLIEGLGHQFDSAALSHLVSPILEHLASVS